MTIHAIRIMGDPVLRTQADPVVRFDEALAKLAQDMHHTMLEVDGVGLAAPQIGISKRIFTYRIEGHEGTVCNPEIEILDASPSEEDASSEGCLSVPGLHYPLERPSRLLLKGSNVDGSSQEIVAEGLLARCFQHETDHLNGKLFIDRLTGEYRTQARQALRQEDFQHHAHGVQGRRAPKVDSSFGSGSAFGTGNAFRA